MSDRKQPANKVAGDAGSEKISDIAAHYLDLVGGANGMFYEFLQYTQNAGQTGGPATNGGAFWQQIMRCRPLEVDGG